MTAITDRFIQPEDVKDLWGLNMLIYGQPGVGKTVLAASAAETELGRDVLFADIEAGTRSLGPKKGVTIFPVKKWDDLTQLYGFLSTTKHAFRTIVVDSLSEAQTICLDEVLGPKVAAGVAPGIQDFGKVKTKMVGLVRAFKSLAINHGWNIIFTALEDHDKDEGTGTLIKSPALSPKTCQAVCASVDGIGYLTVDSKGVRKLQLKQSFNAIAKIRQPAGRAVLPDVVTDPTMAKILDLLSGKSVT